jgi:hypothetical protein
MNNLLEAVLNEKVEGREEEIRFVKKIFNQASGVITIN